METGVRVDEKAPKAAAAGRAASAATEAKSWRTENPGALFGGTGSSCSPSLLTDILLVAAAGNGWFLAN